MQNADNLYYVKKRGGNGGRGRPGIGQGVSGPPLNVFFADSIAGVLGSGPLRVRPAIQQVQAGPLLV